MSHCECGCKEVYYKGLLYIDWSTGYVTQAAECAKCGKMGQVPTMFATEAISFMTKHSDCIEVNK